MLNAWPTSFHKYSSSSTFVEGLILLLWNIIPLIICLLKNLLFTLRIAWSTSFLICNSSCTLIDESLSLLWFLMTCFFSPPSVSPPALALWLPTSWPPAGLSGVVRIPTRATTPRVTYPPTTSGYRCCSLTDSWDSSWHPPRTHGTTTSWVSSSVGTIIDYNR